MADQLLEAAIGDLVRSLEQRATASGHEVWIANNVTGLPETAVDAAQTRLGPVAIKDDEGVRACGCVRGIDLPRPSLVQVLLELSVVNVRLPHPEGTADGNSRHEADSGQCPTNDFAVWLLDRGPRRTADTIDRTATSCGE
ncbi:hypothetical protein ACFVW9_40795 [Streptomyces sp. NPDC058217]|uniref:hypothetical protein n=1 Tax=Streptomyces sp. NPDC058217 TaxID=3346384 RepID=UPI0036E8FD64